MASPLPKLPTSPLPALPANPLPSLHIGRKDSGPRLPRLFRGGHAPRPPLSRPASGAQRPASAPPPPIVHIHPAAPATPPASPQTTQGGKLTRAQVRTHAHGYLGPRMGGRVNNLSPQAQQAIQVLQRRYAGHLVRGHNQAGVAWLNQQKAKHKASQKGQNAQNAQNAQARANMKAWAAAAAAANNNQGPNPVAGHIAQYLGQQPYSPRPSQSTSTPPASPTPPTPGAPQP